MLYEFLCLKEHLATLEEKEEEEEQRMNDDFVDRHTNYDVISDQEMVDKIFGFLPSMIGGQEGQAPLGFEVQWSCSCKSNKSVRIPSVVNSIYWTVQSLGEPAFSGQFPKFLAIEGLCVVTFISLSQ